MDGIIIINKSEGYTSNDVVQSLRKILNTKKVGHAGTLDPLATGVLPILVGEGTKLSKYLMEHDKTYIAKVALGEKKDTGDREGKTVLEKHVNQLDEKKVEEVLKNFLGKQMQIPPMYSAIKKDGKKLYEYAREGQEVEREPREIEIKDIKLIELNKKENTICFEVSCSKGTYIRVLCEDIAEKLNTVGYMKSLVRTRVNKFTLEQAITIEELEKSMNIQNEIIGIEEIFMEKESIALDEKRLKLFLNGVLLKYEKPNDIYKIKDKNGKFIGLGIIKNGNLKRDIIIK